MVLEALEGLCCSELTIADPFLEELEEEKQIFIKETAMILELQLYNSMPLGLAIADKHLALLILHVDNLILCTLDINQFYTWHILSYYMIIYRFKFICCIIYFTPCGFSRMIFQPIIS